MIYTEKNNLGEITFNKLVLAELIQNVLQPWVSSGKIKLLNQKDIKQTSKGVYICLHISLAMGESTSEVVKALAVSLAEGVTETIQIALDDVVVVIDTMFTQKGNNVERNIRYSYNANKDY